MTRKWRVQLMERRSLEFREDVLVPGKVMAGHLQALIETVTTETVVVAVGMPHPTGVLNRLASPDHILDELIKILPNASYHTI